MLLCERTGRVSRTNCRELVQIRWRVLMLSMLDRRPCHPPGFLFHTMRGARSRDVLSRAQDLTNTMRPSTNKLEYTIWADISVEVPLACKGTPEDTPPLEPPSSGSNAITNAASPIPTSEVDVGSPGDLQPCTRDEPCDATCTNTLSHAPGNPARHVPPRQPTAPDAPVLPIEPPSWADSNFVGDAEYTAGTCSPTGVMAAHVQELVKLVVAAEPPTTPFQQALLPRMQPALEASNPCGCFIQRNRVVRSMPKAACCAHSSVAGTQKTLYYVPLVVNNIALCVGNLWD